MTGDIKHKSKSKKAKRIAVIDSKVGNYEMHPFFVKKANEAKALIKIVAYLQKKPLLNSPLFIPSLKKCRMSLVLFCLQLVVTN